MKRSLLTLKRLGVTMIVLIFMAFVWQGGWWRSRWSDKYLFNIWVVSDQGVELLSFKGGKAKKITFEGGTVIPILGSTGEIKLESVEKYAKTNKNGGITMKKSLDGWMRIISDGIYWNASNLSARDVLFGRSNIMVRDRLRLASWLMTGEKMDEIRLDGETEMTIDEQKIVRVDMERWARQTQVWWAEDLVRLDKRRVRLVLSDSNEWLEGVFISAGMAVVEKTEAGSVGQCRILLPESDKNVDGIPKYLMEKFGCRVSVEMSGDLEIELIF